MRDIPPDHLAPKYPGCENLTFAMQLSQESKKYFWWEFWEMAHERPKSKSKTLLQNFLQISQGSSKIENQTVTMRHDTEGKYSFRDTY